MVVREHIGVPDVYLLRQGYPTRRDKTPMKYLPIVFLLASLPGLAQDSAQYRACNEKAKTQTEMNACAGQEAARVDAELNEVYRKLVSQAASQQEAVAKIKAAERAWIAYRDAYMDAMYPAKDKQAEYGSIYPMEAALLRAKLTQRQVTALKELLRQYSGAEQSGTSETVNPKDGGLHLQIRAVASNNRSRTWFHHCHEVLRDREPANGHLDSACRGVVAAIRA